MLVWFFQSTIIIQTSDAHIVDANGNWNNLQDESWDGYLEDASFADQHGSASTFFETGTIMSNDQLSGIQGQIDALNTDIANLETQEAELTTSVLNKKV